MNELELVEYGECEECGGSTRVGYLIEHQGLDVCPRCFGEMIQTLGINDLIDAFDAWCSANPDDVNPYVHQVNVSRWLGSLAAADRAALPALDELSRKGLLVVL